MTIIKYSEGTIESVIKPKNEEEEAELEEKISEAKKAKEDKEDNLSKKASDSPFWLNK
jgi:hypothetical protein